jgi:hypothetical protein
VAFLIPLSDPVFSPCLPPPRWQNPRSEGKLFSFDVVDKEGGEIRVTAWNNAVDVFEPLLQVCGGTMMR